MDVETQQPIGCKMRFLVGYDKGKTFSPITTSKEEIDYQFRYPGRNKVIKEYKNIKDNYSWSGEDDSELVHTEPVKNTHSPKIYDLQTPLKKSKGKDDTEVVLSSDSSSDFDEKAKESFKSDKAISTSSLLHLRFKDRWLLSRS